MTEGFLDIKNYKKQKKIGQGGFSEVYRVVEKSTGNIFAAKISLKEVDLNSPKDMLNIAREVNILSKLEHPAILKFIGYSNFDFNHDPRPVLITEYFTNGSLEQILELERCGRSLTEWDQTKKLVVIYGIAAGMRYLHSHDIIHRDLKPDNIFLDEYLLPKIGDFGLSKFYRNKATSVSTDTSSGIKGTFAYIAPEILADADYTIRYTKACDVYSFSLIVYEIITGEIPFEKHTLYQLIRKVSQGSRPEFKYPISPSYRRLIEDCWAQKPNNRPTFEEILELLRNDEGFLTDDVEKNDFRYYAEFIDKSLDVFKSTRRIITFSDIVNPFSKTFKKVKIYASPPPSPESHSDKSPGHSKKKIVPIHNSRSIIKPPPPSDKPPSEGDSGEELIVPVYPEREFSQLNSTCQKLVHEAKHDVEKQFVVGKSIFEGIIGFPRNSEIGITYLKAALKNGSIDSAIYYCRILIESKLIPPNPEKAEKYLLIFFPRKNATIYTLYGKAKKLERNFHEAIKYFIKSSSLGNGEAMYEYGIMLLNGEGVPRDEIKGNQYIEMAIRNGYQIEKDDDTYSPRSRSNSIFSTEGRKKIKYIKSSTFDKLDESCQNSVISAESGENTALVYVARGFIEGNNGFPLKIKQGLRYLEYGIELKNVDAMQLYGNILLDGKIVPKDEEKGINILYESASILNNTEMKLKLIDIILNHQSFDIRSRDNMNVNFPLAKRYCKETADSGNTKAMVLYGKLCMKEKKCKYGEINSDFNEALKYFRLAAENEDGEGMAHYGRFLDFGYGVIKPNPIEAMEYYRKSYKKGDLTGYTFYGSSLIEGIEGVDDIRKDEAKGIRLVKHSCDCGNPYGMANYGYFLNKGGPILKRDVNQSIFYYQKAADLGCNVAMANLAVCYRDGTGIKKDVKTAKKYFQLAIEEGYPRAAFILGNLLINGDKESSIKPDLKEGLRNIQYAADHGIKSAMYLFAYFMYYKKNVDMNPALLKKYLKNGIGIGHAPCMRLYGIILMAGDVLAEDKYEGVRYIKMAADLRDVKAMELYADALEKGEGVMKNIDEARRYREMAARAKHSA